MARSRLGDEREGAARQTMLAVLIEADDLHRDMAGQRILLQMAQNRPAEHIGKKDVERHGCRLILPRELDRFISRRCNDGLEAAVACKIEEDAGVVRIVLDDEQYAVAGYDFAALIGNGLDHLEREARRRSNGRRGPRLAERNGKHGAGRAGESLGKVKCERAAYADSTPYLNFTAEQVRKFAADRKPKARAAVFAAGARIRLLERFEDELLLFGWNT